MVLDFNWSLMSRNIIQNHADMREIGKEAETGSVR